MRMRRAALHALPASANSGRRSAFQVVSIGGAALATETVAHFFALGPERDVSGGRSWATIGFFEAHRLAIIFGNFADSCVCALSRGG
jgi:hypothetical protein